MTNPGEAGCGSNQVQAPDDRVPASHPGFGDEFLKAQKIALQYILGRLVVLAVMPVTPSGKIQKFKLRERVRA